VKRPGTALIAAIALLGGASSVATATATATGSAVDSIAPAFQNMTASAASASLGPAPPGGRLRIVLERTYADPTAVLSGDGFRVHGLIRPYRPNSHVVVRFFHVHNRVRRTTVLVLPARGGTGYFQLPVRLSDQGTITVEATLPATATTPALTAVPQAVLVLSHGVASGSSSPSVRLMQELLARRRYAINVSGTFDSPTARAVMAFRKEADLGRSEAASSTVLRALLEGRGSFPVRYPSHGKHIEADLAHQVLAEIDVGGSVRRIYQFSSGKPSTPTVVGHFAVYRKDFGTNSEGMVDSNYFIGGYAIHGYADVPNFAASHGCLRIPIPDALAVFNWLQIGDPVDVYEHGAGGSRRINSHAGP
jgi:lipoprotein-anchoring transpeptidase ErfK/SrfK